MYYSRYILGFFYAIRVKIINFAADFSHIYREEYMKNYCILTHLVTCVSGAKGAI